MNFIISANTDIGLTKSTNQDSVSVKVINTPTGRMAFGILCDGMGGLSDGEVASAAVIRAFDQWVYNSLPALSSGPIEDYMIRQQWGQIVDDQNNMIKAYGSRMGIRLGTTAVVMLLTESRYYIMNVGDSRAYELTDNIRQITNDQTFVQREVDLGRMTPEEAMTDERRSVLLQCVGSSDDVYPDYFFGDTQNNAVYMLCCDGFRHEITPAEMYQMLQPGALLSDEMMNANSLSLIELNKQRAERDNITVALVRTF